MSELHALRRDIAHLGHVELLTPKPEESLWFFREVLGMYEVARHGQSVYLRAWGEYEQSRYGSVRALWCRDCV